MKIFASYKIYVLFVSLGLLVGCGSRPITAEKSLLQMDPKTAVPMSLQRLQALLDQPQKAVDWQLTYQSALLLKPIHDQRTEQIWLKLLERKAPVILKSTSELPGVMSPLHMLQAVAMRSLRETKDKKYLEVFYKIYQETDERVIKEMAKEHILALGGQVP